jgi:hypothetical protein
LLYIPRNFYKKNGCIFFEFPTHRPSVILENAIGIFI